MATVLITGAGGFVGSHVLEAVLGETEHRVIVVESFRHNGLSDNVCEVLNEGGTPWSGSDRADRVEVLTHDMTAPFSARQYEKLREVTHIINVASRCHVGESITHPADFYRNNINLMVELLEWCRDRGPQLQGIIHMSTDEVFGPGGAHQDGYDWHHPSSPYAASKAAQEDLCMAYRTTYGLPITVVNSANMFGERQSMLAFIPRAIVAAATGQMLDIHTYAGQPGSRWYTYVRNVASRLAALLDRERRHYPDRMLLPGQQCMDNLALALAIEELVPGGKVKYRLLNADNIRPGYDPSYPRLQPNNQWAEGLTSFADGLVNTVAWMLADPGRVDTDLDFLP